MNEKTVSADILENYPPIDEKKIDALLVKEIEESPTKIIVLDDDPTGVQTVHDISVIRTGTRTASGRGWRRKISCSIY